MEGVACSNEVSVCTLRGRHDAGDFHIPREVG
jgi:hypothetical protein